MSDLARIMEALDAKRREIVDFAVDLSGDVLQADVSEGDRWQAAVSLLELLAKGRPQRQRVIIDHEVAEPPKALEKPRYVVPAHVAEIAARIEQTGILPEPVVRSEPVTEMRVAAVEKPARTKEQQDVINARMAAMRAVRKAKAAAPVIPEPEDIVEAIDAAPARNPGRREKRFTDDVIAEALASTNTIAAAAAMVGCSEPVVYAYRKRYGIKESPGAKMARMANMRAARGGGFSKPKLIRQSVSDEDIAAALATGATPNKAAGMLRCHSRLIHSYRERNGLTAVSDNGGIDWNAANIDKLINIATKSPRPSNEEIGAAMGTTASAIMTAMSRFGVTKRAAKQAGSAPADLSGFTKRPCMACLTPFLSEHKHNRLCPKCKAPNREEAA